MRLRYISVSCFSLFRILREVCLGINASLGVEELMCRVAEVIG